MQGSIRSYHVVINTYIDDLNMYLGDFALHPCMCVYVCVCVFVYRFFTIFSLCIWLQLIINVCALHFIFMEIDKIADESIEQRQRHVINEQGKYKYWISFSEHANQPSVAERIITLLCIFRYKKKNLKKK